MEGASHTVPEVVMPLTATDSAATTEGTQKPRLRKDDPRRIEKLYRKKARKLEQKLHQELTRNVELYNRRSKAIGVLQKVAKQNADLLDTIAEITELPLAEPAIRDATSISADQKDMLYMVLNI